MSLIGALHTSFAGIRNTEAQINVTASNVTNAGREGYTRKELTNRYITTNSGTIPIGESITTINYNPYLLEELIADTSIAAQNSTISNYLSNYVNNLGALGGENSISAYINNLATNLDQLALTPEDPSLKAQVVNDADILATELNRLSNSIQDYRLQADNEIENTVTKLNTSLDKLNRFNEEIALSSATGVSVADLEDERRIELEKISAIINIDYFVNNQNQLNIYAGGRPLLDSNASTITYTSNTALDKTTLYPGGFVGINVDGFDITAIIKGGELGGLINIRDSVMVEEQAKLDEFANVMITQLNTLLNQGASATPRNNILGDVKGLALGDAIAGIGNFRITTIDNAGVVQVGVDFNVGAYATLNDMVNDINLVLGPNVTASIAAPDGQLLIVANNAGEGVVFNELTSDIGVDNQGFSSYFGLNNLFDGLGADDIKVSTYIKDNPEYISTGRLSSAGALAPGDVGVTAGNSTLTKEMNEAFSNQYNFNAAGGFAAQTESIDNYVDKIIANIAYQASAATDTARITLSLMEQTKTSLQNISGVNIDEEMAHLVDLEARYEASAAVLAAIQEMFDTLIGAIR